LTRFDQEEANILSYIQQHRPELEELFLQNIDRGRQGIFHRLLMAVVRENIAGLGDKAKWVEREGATCELQIPFQSGKVLHAPVKARHSLARFDLGGPALLCEDGVAHPIEHPVELLDLIKEEGIITDEAGEKRFERFRQEIQNSAANFALALAGAELRRRALSAKAKGTGITTAIDWAREQAKAEPTFSPLVFFEQWVVEGHPLHPGAKIKMGLEVCDVIGYSPEWGAAPAVVPVAVKKHLAVFTSLGGRTPSGLLYEEHPGLRGHVSRFLEEMGLDANDYELIPVHPWQYEHTLPALYAKEIENGDIVPVPNYRIRTEALMSFRSLAPVQARGEGKHHIKTCVNVQTTGAVRTISPNSAENGTTISRILRDVQEKEGRFGGTFVILEERVGVYYSPEDPTLTHEERMTLGKNLASILRENPENHVQDGDISMPASALIAKSPLSGELVVLELIGRFAEENGIADLREAAVAFIRTYANVCLPAFLTVMSRYGISLEGHMQNSVAVFSGGTPVKMILRDFGGVRILRERLARQGFQAEFFPGSATIIDDVEDMRNKIFYPVFQNHFGELITAIVRSLGLDEYQLWQPVAAICREVFNRLKQDPLIGAQAAEDEAALFAPQIDLKAMATMRLLGDVTRYTFAKVPNPLAETQEVNR
jgi:siderophore synthetase component